MILPAAVPEIAVADIGRAVAYYTRVLGFTSDWADLQSGIGGISRGDCRLFITSPEFRDSRGNKAPIVCWLNLSSRVEVDELFAEWDLAGANMISRPEDKPWKLREFILADPDGNLLRVFYDFRDDGP